jgi:hypothetical protein
VSVNTELTSSVSSKFGSISFTGSTSQPLFLECLAGSIAIDYPAAST